MTSNFGASVSVLFMTDKTCRQVRASTLFVQVKSIRGVYLASQLLEDNSIHTVITYNRGATWEKVRRPERAPCKNESKVTRPIKCLWERNVSLAPIDVQWCLTKFVCCCSGMQSADPQPVQHREVGSRESSTEHQERARPHPRARFVGLKFSFCVYIFSRCVTTVTERKQSLSMTSVLLRSG